MGINWGKIVQEVLVYLLPILTVQVAVWLLGLIRKQWTELKQKNPNLAYWLEEGAQIAVKAAEQGKVAELIEDKKKYAVDWLTKFLAEKGMSVDVALIEGAIEAAVHDVFTAPQASTPEP